MRHCHYVLVKIEDPMHRLGHDGDHLPDDWVADHLRGYGYCIEVDCVGDNQTITTPEDVFR